MCPATFRTVPFFIGKTCPTCDSILVCTNSDDDEEEWYDEWVCTTDYCPESEGIFLDWPDSEFEKLAEEHLDPDGESFDVYDIEDIRELMIGKRGDV